MHIILAVVKDILLFIRDSWTDLLGSARPTSTEATLLPPHVPPLGLVDGSSRESVDSKLDFELDLEIEEEGIEDNVPQTFRSAADILDHSLRPQKNTVLYVGEDNTPLYTNPTTEFDGVVATLPYGAMVMALENKGRWVNISYANHTGWALRDMFFDRAAYVHPDFVVGEPNDTDSINTLRTRACIGNEFHADKAELPLTAGEYVLYRLYKKGVRTVPWPDARPRIPGIWHELLRGREQVYITIEPQGGSIMEYVREGGEGHLAFVEAVFPDDTISLSEVDYPDQGIYNERVLSREEWRELRPVFIGVG